jgi:pimeloyl-ACP methyl ester carboxylesterase
MLHAVRTVLFLVLFVVALGAKPVPAGPGQFTLPDDGEPLTVFTYKPPTYTGGPLLVVCHGVGRNAEDYRNFAINLAERFKVLVVAPLFDKERFPTERYQRGGLVQGGRVQPPEKWTYAVISKLVAHVRELEARPGLPYYLIGHSAGGQFLVRMTAFQPGEARRIIAANPGSHLFPHREAPFGYGFGGLPAELATDAVLRRFLAAPLTLYLGTGDVVQDESLDQTADAMKQGATRIERGRNCFEFARQLAAERGWPFAWRKVETAGIGHVAAQMFAAREAEDALFGAEKK